MPLEKYQPNRKRRATPGPRDAVLYVEDDDGNWEVTQRKLRDQFNVDRARNAEEAFERLRKKQYAAILMDIELQGSDLDGVEITRILRNKYADEAPAYTAGVTLSLKTPIIFVTAYSAHYQESQLKECGGDRLIRKPVDYVQLSLAITNAALSTTHQRMARLIEKTSKS